jgi:hypothetical protein
VKYPAGFKHLLQIEEEERQVLLLALAHLANERPGWDDMLNRIALRIDNEDSKHPGRAAMYDALKTLWVERELPINVLGIKVEPP